jgi:hypothetical protein
VDGRDLPQAPGPLTSDARARLSEHIAAALGAPA